jgi:hypothetical protein
MAFTVTTGDPRAAFITGGYGSFSVAAGPYANSANGAQTRFVFDGVSGTAPLLRIVRGTSGTTNLVLKNSDGEDCFVTVSSDQTTLTSSATVVA